MPKFCLVWVNRNLVLYSKPTPQNGLSLYLWWVSKDPESSPLTHTCARVLAGLWIPTGAWTSTPSGLLQPAYLRLAPFPGDWTGPHLGWSSHNTDPLLPNTRSHTQTHTHHHHHTITTTASTIQSLACLEAESWCCHKVTSLFSCQSCDRIRICFQVLSVLLLLPSFPPFSHSLPPSLPSFYLVALLLSLDLRCWGQSRLNSSSSSVHVRPLPCLRRWLIHSYSLVHSLFLLPTRKCV